MAFVTQAFCHECKKPWQACVGAGEGLPTECPECATARIDRERREHFGALDALTIEERLRKLEEWVYNYRPPRTGPMLF